LIALASYQNGLGWPVLSTICPTGGDRSSPYRKRNKTFVRATASTE